MCHVGVELAGQVADVAGRVFHSARTWSDADISKRVRANLERLPMVTQLHADGSASFCDGSSIDRIDSVIYCTGYKYKYRLLEHLHLIETGELPLPSVLFIFACRPDCGMPAAKTALRACIARFFSRIRKACVASYHVIKRVNPACLWYCRG